MRKGALTLALMIALSYSPPVSSTVPADAASYIEGLGARAVTLLNQPNQTSEAKEAQVRSLLAENFDLDGIGQFVVGRYWDTMSNHQRTTYLDIFREFVLRSYSHRFGGYSGSQFTVTGSQPAGRNDVIVSTQIHRPEDRKFEAGWRVSTQDGQPKIVDVIISGVSMAMTQRSDFTTVIRRDGVDGLISRLRSQLAGLQHLGPKPQSSLDAPSVMGLFGVGLK